MSAVGFYLHGDSTPLCRKRSYVRESSPKRWPCVELSTARLAAPCFSVLLLPVSSQSLLLETRSHSTFYSDLRTNLDNGTQFKAHLDWCSSVAQAQDGGFESSERFGSAERLSGLSRGPATSDPVP